MTYFVTFEVAGKKATLEFEKKEYKDIFIGVLKRLKAKYAETEL